MNAAHLHLILNHIPVLGGLATFSLLVLARNPKNDALAKLTLQFMVLMGILALPVYFSGEPAEEVIEHFPGVTEAFISQHEKFALYSLICTELLAIAGLVCLFVSRKNPGKVRKYWMAIGALALVNAGLMLATANYGGQIRHTEIRNSDSTAKVPENTKAPDHD